MNGKTMMMPAIRVARSSLLSLGIALAAGIAMFGLPGSVEAHGEIINVEPTQAAPGEALIISGEEFPPGEEIVFTLEGVKGTVSVGHAEAGEDGTFSVTVDLPSDAPAGSYQFVASTEDDSIVLDFSVLQGATGGATAGETILKFQRSTNETIAIGLITAALIIGGSVLVLSSTRSHA